MHRWKYYTVITEAIIGPESSFDIKVTVAGLQLQTIYLVYHYLSFQESVSIYNTKGKLEIYLKGALLT
jgi:hypothetical protein